MKKVYISGPITGVDNAFENFERAENLLRKLEYEPVNPFKIQHKKNSQWLDFMKEDIKALLECEIIFLLDNWEKSKGAVIENNIALGLGYIQIIECKLIESISMSK